MSVAPIPDDSKFCPDCGTPVVNTEEIRAKAKEIVSNYKQGYEFYVNNGTLPRFAYNSTIENCEKIIAKKQEIIKKHNEIIQEEKRRKEAKELEENRQEVIRIHNQYDKGYDFYAKEGYIPYFSISLSSRDCDKVIAYRYQIKRRHNEIIEEKRIRDNASAITISYAMGYYYFVNIGAVPRFVHNLDISKCKQILVKKDEIIAKHYEIVEKEEERLKALERQRQQEVERQKRMAEEQQLRKKAETVRQACRRGYPSVGMYLILMTIGIGAMILYWHKARLSETRGMEALLYFIPMFVLIMVSSFLGSKLFMILDDANCIDKDKIDEWKKMHPNDPVCKYL